MLKSNDSVRNIVPIAASMSGKFAGGAQVCGTAGGFSAEYLRRGCQGHNLAFDRNYLIARFTGRVSLLISARKKLTSPWLKFPVISHNPFSIGVFTTGV